MTDTKMEMMCQRKYWEEAIEHGLNKHMDKSLLYALTDPIGRATIIQAIEEGRYVVQPPVIQSIPKPAGGTREIFVNSQMDRVVLSMINQIYMELYGHLIHPCCVSYQKGLGVPQIIRSVTNKLKDGYHGYICDLSKYFDRVNKETLFATLDMLSTGSPIDKVVRDYYADDRIIKDGEIVEHYKSLAQGCACSVILANLVLRPIDTELAKLDIIYYRYSDDLLLLGKDADKALDLLKEMLVPMGLELNPKKIKYIDENSEFTFLGAKIQGTTVDISDESVERFKKEIRSITKMRKGMKIKNRTTQRRAIKQINNYLYLSYMKNPKNFGWGFYFYSLCTTDKTIRELDYFVKDHIKAMYTGKWNSVTNMNKTSNEELEQMGYLSMVHMFKLFKMSKEVFKAEILRKG